MITIYHYLLERDLFRIKLKINYLAYGIFTYLFNKYQIYIFKNIRQDKIALIIREK